VRVHVSVRRWDVAAFSCSPSAYHHCFLVTVELQFIILLKQLSSYTQVLRSGRLSSVFDLIAQRECLCTAPAAGNQLVVYNYSLQTVLCTALPFALMW